MPCPQCAHLEVAGLRFWCGCRCHGMAWFATDNGRIPPAQDAPTVIIHMPHRSTARASGANLGDNPSVYPDGLSVRTFAVCSLCGRPFDSDAGHR